MLKLRCAVGETVFIGRGIRVAVLSVDGHGDVQLGFHAPDDIAVSRAGRGIDYHLARQREREVRARKNHGGGDGTTSDDATGEAAGG